MRLAQEPWTLSNTKRFLILDPDPAACLQAADAAETLGFEVVHTADPDIFRDYCLKFFPDVVALDLGPSQSQTDGVELLRFLAGTKSRDAVLILTDLEGRVRESALRLGREQGLCMLGALSKPLDAQGLVQHLLEVREEEPDDN